MKKERRALFSCLFERQQIVVHGLPAVVEIHVAVGEGFLHLFGKRGGVRFVDPLSVIEGDDLVRVVFQLIEKF